MQRRRRWGLPPAAFPKKRPRSSDRGGATRERCDGAAAGSALSQQAIICKVQRLRATTRLCRQTAHPNAALPLTDALLRRHTESATTVHTQVLQPSRRARAKGTRMAARLLATTARRLAMPAAAALTATTAASVRQ